MIFFVTSERFLCFCVLWALHYEGSTAGEKAVWHVYLFEMLTYSGVPFELFGCCWALVTVV